MLTILNDCHIGVERSAGTTIATRAALKQHVTNSFGRQLPAEGDLMILGDLFDRYVVDVADTLETIRLLSGWLMLNIGKLIIVAGNHDLSKTSGIQGSVHLVASVLEYMHPRKSVLITEPTMTDHGYVIPHLPNQAAFDAALAEVPECDYLFLHVNYDNKFAAQSDQSLNISREQVEASKAKFIICGHEHQFRRGPKMLLPGNQIATSVADWQGCTNKVRVVIVDGEGVLEPVVSKDSEYIELPWTDLQVTPHKFVRVIGEATTEQAAQVVTAVAKFRAISPALVIGNAVQIATEGSMEGFSESLESVRAFDVWAALGEVLEASELKTLQDLT